MKSKSLEACLCVFVCLIASGALGQSYQVIDLGAGLGNGSYAQAINNNGQVAGYWTGPDGVHAFLYEKGKAIDLGTLGGANIFALSINDMGQVAGVAETPSGMEAFLYQLGSITNLGKLGGLHSYAYGINNQGQIVGYVDTLSGARAFAYKDGTKIELGTLGGTNSFGYGVNTALQIAGASLTTNNHSLHAFFWQTNSILDLNEFPGLSQNWELKEARGINDLGQLVGSGIFQGREHAFLYSRGSVADLGILAGGTNSYALGVNNKGEVVGASSTAKGVHAILWRAARIGDLNAFIPVNTGWELQEASGINDLGQIVGHGVIKGEQHAFLLLPVSTGSGVAAVAGAKSLRPRVDNSFTVTITNPVNNAVFAAPTNLTLLADVSDSYGSVTQVQFFASSTLLGNGLSVLFNTTWTNPLVGSYALTAIASDNTGLTATSAVVTITVTLPTPGSIMLWLKPDAGMVLSSSNTVSAWQDQSGNSNNATQTTGNSQPSFLTNTLNGYPVVHFDGNSRFLNLPNLMNGATQAEAFIVLRASQDMPSVGRSLWRFGTSYYPEQYAWTDGNIYEDFGNTSRPSIGDPPQPLDQFHLYGVDSSSGELAIRFNGESFYRSSSNTVAFSSSPTLGSSTGAGGFTAYFAGDMAEVLIYGRVLSSQERDAVGAYLNARYSLASVPLTPTNLVAQPISPTQISLTWSEIYTQATTQVSIERKTGSNGLYLAIAQLSSANSYVDTNLAAGTTYFYRLRTVNLTAWSDYSNEAQATTLGTGSDLPFTNLIAWLKADAGLGQVGTHSAVNFWADQSSSGKNASQAASANQPTWVAGALNGLPVVRFNGTSSYLNWANVLNGTTSAEAFVVLRATTNHPSTVQGLWHLGGCSGAGATGGAYPDTTGAIWDDFGVAYGWPYGLGTLAQPLNQFHVYEVAAQAGSWTAWLNGQMQCAATGTSYGEYYSYFYLGYTGSRYFAGDIAEVLIFNRTLTASERVVVNEYVNSKYGLVPAAAIGPTNLAAQAVSPTQVGLTWSATLSGGATQISIERKTGSNGVYTVVAQLSGAASYLDTNLTAATTYFYRVRAVNLTSWSDYSNEAQATTLASGSDVPLSNLLLWLKADTGLAQLGTNTPVSFWADQSGKANHATQPAASNQPTRTANSLNGLPAVHFNGTNSYLNWPNILNGTTSAEAFVVLRATMGRPSTAQGLWHLGGCSGAGATGGAYPDPTGAIWDDFGVAYGWPYNVGVPIQPLDQYHVYEVAAAGGSWAAWLNGQLQVAASGTSYGEYYSYFYLGYTGSRFFAGDIAEVLIFNRVLTTAEKQAVRQYVLGRFSMAPAVSLTSPPNNSVLPPAANIVLQASASVAGGTLKQVEFYQGTTLLGAVTNPPYSLAWSNAPPGIYILTARAIGYTLSATSSVVNIRVGAVPTVSVIAPIDRTHLPALSSVTVTANATGDVAIVQVQLLQGTNTLATLVTSPYSILWTNISPGTYPLTATALDTDGFSATSQPVILLIDPEVDPTAVGDNSGPTSLKVYTPLK